MATPGVLRATAGNAALVEPEASPWRGTSRLSFYSALFCAVQCILAPLGR